MLRHQQLESVASTLAKPILAPCANTAGGTTRTDAAQQQLWTLTDDGHLQSLSNGHPCLDVPCTSTSRPLPPNIDLYKCMNNTNKCGVHENQKFKLNPHTREDLQQTQPDSWVTITNNVEGSCLTVSATTVEAQPCNSTANGPVSTQLWRVVPTPGMSTPEPTAFQLVEAASSARCLGPALSPSPSPPGPPTPPTPTMPPTPAPATTQVWVMFLVCIFSLANSVLSSSYLCPPPPSSYCHHTGVGEAPWHTRWSVCRGDAESRQGCCKHQLFLRRLAAAIISSVIHCA
jgi:hypothetical protein